jgi:glycine cleavage system H protein
MSEHLVFLMGHYAAAIPTDRRYATNHMWALGHDDLYRFGFTAYAVRLMQDVYFLDWLVDEGVQLEARQEIGALESKKAEASLYAPIAGRLSRLNQQVLADPSAINLDTYGGGWLFEMQGQDDALLTPQQYVQHLESVWETTQQTIKGQLN